MAGADVKTTPLYPKHIALSGGLFVASWPPLLSLHRAHMPTHVPLRLQVSSAFALHQIHMGLIPSPPLSLFSCRLTVRPRHPACPAPAEPLGVLMPISQSTFSSVFIF